MQPSERDLRAYDAFKSWLPYYYSQFDEVPFEIRIWLAVNKYPNAAMGCIDIANHMIEDRKLAKQAQAELVHMQVWKGIEPNG